MRFSQKKRYGINIFAYFKWFAGFVAFPFLLSAHFFPLSLRRSIVDLKRIKKTPTHSPSLSWLGGPPQPSMPRHRYALFQLLTTNAKGVPGVFLSLSRCSIASAVPARGDQAREEKLKRSIEKSILLRRSSIIRVSLSGARPFPPLPLAPRRRTRIDWKGDDEHGLRGMPHR